jgi:hypothetical protein
VVQVLEYSLTFSEVGDVLKEGKWNYTITNNRDIIYIYIKINKT